MALQDNSSWLHVPQIPHRVGLSGALCIFVKRRSGFRVTATDSPLLCPQGLVSEICLLANLVHLTVCYTIFVRSF